MKMSKSLVIANLVTVVFSCAAVHARAQEKKALYPAMAPMSQYLSPDEKSEIALARSAAPASIADAAEVMVLGPAGYSTAVKGTNGFICIVERSWANPTDDAGFWNPKMRAPTCFNAPAARTYLPIFLFKSKLVLAGKSQKEIAAMTATALNTKEIPPLEPASLCYMMSKQQYLNDLGKNWHPHLMFIFPGDVVKILGADRPDSPAIVANSPEERVTIDFVIVDKWSDGTPAPQTMSQ